MNKEQLEQQLSKLNLLHSYKNGNVFVRIYDDGTKVRETQGDDEPFMPDLPESCDCKITNWCDGTLANSSNQCLWCHEMSNVHGKHANIDRVLDIVKDMPPGAELACLSGDTIVHGENGSIEISKLKVGDKIYDSSYKLRKVVKIAKSDKQPYLVKANKGFKVIASKDHPFIVDGQEMVVEDLRNQKIDLLKQKPTSHKKITKVMLDLSAYMANENNSENNNIAEFIKNNNLIDYNNRILEFDEKLAWLYGFVVGDRYKETNTIQNLESNLLERVSKIHQGVFSEKCKTYYKENWEAVESRNYAFYKALFFKVLNVGSERVNRNLSFLYKINNKNLIRATLMGVFEKSGSLQKEINRINGKDIYNLTLNVYSKYLAYDVLFLLNKHFGVRATCVYSDNLYKIIIRTAKNIQKIFPGFFNDKKQYPNVDKDNTNRDYIKINSIALTAKEELYDITLEEKSTHIFPINGYVLTHNCGGGATLSHPDILKFLYGLKKLNLIANVTINQKHIARDKPILEKIFKEELVKGIGISYSDPRYLDDIGFILERTDNAVFHMIMGINQLKDIDVLIEHCEKYNKKQCKVLILGYKNFGLGINYYLQNKAVEECKQQWIKKLPLYFYKGKKLTIAFDNLAIDQLNLKKHFNKEMWNMFYQGDDFSHTMYIDAVEQKFAPTSCSTERHSFNDYTLKEYFNKFKKNSGK